ncbi:MAG: acyl-ACP thioesterase domain-containing protein [Ilumatobacteraceae bacterium]
MSEVAFEMAGRPFDGRTFVGSRRVRLGDCSPGGRLRLDSTARYLQDLSDDDTRDAGLAQMTWVVRRTVIDIHRFPTYLESLEMVTWCSAIGSRWAERRIDISSAAGGSINSATLWVHIDSDTMRPLAPPPAFAEVFRGSAAGRSVSPRLTLEAPPPDLDLTPWPTRFTDFDVMNHVNNAIAFALVEEAIAGRRHLRAPLRVEVEYRAPIDRDIPLSIGGIGLDAPRNGFAETERDRERACRIGSDAYAGWLVDNDRKCLIAFRITPH